MPTYNNADFLPDAIQSILQQSCPVAEIIVVDDGSSDHTAQVLEQFTGAISSLRQQNAGPAAARNLGIAAARSEYIAFLDADDLWVANKIERQLAVMRRFDGNALLLGDMAEIGVDGEVVIGSALRKHVMLDFFRDLAETPVPDAMARLLQKNFVPTGTVMVRRAILEEVGVFDSGIRYGEDLELWSRVAARYPVICMPEVQLLRRQHETNATKNSGPMLRDLTRVMEKVRNWGGAQLRSQGVDPDRLVAAAWADLGYWHFARDEYAEAQHAFMRGFREKPTLRAATYAAASALPASLTRRLRRLKQKLARTED